MDPHSKDFPFRLLSAFLSSFSHRVRTPLSVISNDLSYVRSLHPELELERSERKIQELLTLFRDLGLRQLLEVAPEAAQAWSPSCLQDASESKDTPRPSFSVGVPQAALQYFEKHFFALLSQYQTEANRRCEFWQEDSSTLLRVRQVNSTLFQPDPPELFSLLTPLFCDRLDTDSPLPPLLDAFFLFFDIRVLVEVQANEWQFTLRFPSP